MNALINNVNVEFIIENEVVFCDTLKLARVFEQEHKNILQTIKNLPFSDFNEQNFKLVSYIDSRGRKQPCYNLTRDGFSLLVMGFTGEKAYRWKIEFIKAFNLMEAELKRLGLETYKKEITKLKRELALAKPNLIKDDLQRECDKLKREYSGLIKDWNGLTHDYMRVCKERNELKENLAKLQTDFLATTTKLTKLI